MGSRVARMEEDRHAFKILTGKPIGKILLGRPKRRWQNNIGMNPKEISVSTRKWVNSS